MIDINLLIFRAERYRKLMIQISCKILSLLSMKHKLHTIFSIHLSANAMKWYVFWFISWKRKLLGYVTKKEKKRKEKKKKKKYHDETLFYCLSFARNSYERKKKHKSIITTTCFLFFGSDTLLLHQSKTEVLCVNMCAL